MVSGLYLYTAADRTIQRGQLLTRRTVEAVPTVADASVLEVSEEELKVSILLFYSLLDEQQRRLYAGLVYTAAPMAVDGASCRRRGLLGGWD